MALVRRRDLLALAGSGALATWAPRARAYGLDAVSRRVPEARIVHCPKVDLVTYRGTHVGYRPRAEVYVEFAARLARFEALAVEVGTALYGRGPATVVHLGARLCRRTRRDPTTFSEHAFGNAIDVAGFDFPPLAAERELPSGTHRTFRDPFAVRVRAHWKPQPGVASLHATFLRTLLRRLIARDDVFRVLLGPAHPGHAQHFHFDCGPTSEVDVFEPEP